MQKNKYGLTKTVIWDKIFFRGDDIVGFYEKIRADRTRNAD